MTTVLIDGNNLIGKLKSLRNIQKKDKQRSREKLAFILDKFYNHKKCRVYLFMDGYPGDAINSNNLRIIYSENKTADDAIKIFIEQTTNTKNISVITSDSNLAQFAKKCSCKIISSDDFSRELSKESAENAEDSIIESMDAEEFKKIFNAGKG